jgi:hypothetical protein
VGGVVGPKAVAFILATFPGLAVPALLLAGPLVLAALALWWIGQETTGKRLEDIQRSESAPAKTG